MNLNEYFAANHEPINDDELYSINTPVKRIHCVDGFNLSVQASRGAYCSPRENVGPWSMVEVGFPSAEPELIMEYAEQSEDPTGTVYGYVPIGLVEELIELHGGQQQV